MNVTIFTINWDTINRMANIKLMKLHDAFRFLLVTPVINLIYVAGHTNA